MPVRGSGESFSFSQKEIQKIVGLKLGIMSDDLISRLSVVNIESDQLLDKNRKPMREGVHDPRMGTMDRDQNCDTCGCDTKECPGHFGSIKLARPIYHPGYINLIVKILRCVCSDCGMLKCANLRLGESSAERDKILKTRGGPQRFRKVFELCSKEKACQVTKSGGCGNKNQATYSRDKLSIIQKFQQSKNHGGEMQDDPLAIFRPEDARAILSKISDDDVRLLGMDPKHSRPEWMVIKVLAVAPPPVRPSVEAGEGLRSEDDLTYAYREIVKMNKELSKSIESGGQRGEQDELQAILQMQVATLMDNNISDVPQQRHTGGRAIKDIRSRLKGKEGRVRGNLMGKRVDFSARSVITPDPILALDQLGVPQAIAKNLTVPEHVTHQNRFQLQQLVENGPNRWPGAKTVIRSEDGKAIDLANRKTNESIALAPGYIVERHLRDGDYVIFNRQPSLHKMSLMGHRVKVLPFQTFRLNLSVTSPYNADFDGDEMNMHVPQSFETMAEIKEIMAVPLQIVAPKNNAPVMGIVQDSLLAIYLFTFRDTFVTKDVLMNLVMWIDYQGSLPTPAILKPQPLWTGKQVISMIIPKVNIRRKKAEWDCRKDSNVLIKNGELICGILDKKIVGSSPGGLVHVVWRDQSPYACRDFMSSAQNIVNQWLHGNGFTIGVQDMIASSETTSQIQEKIKFHKKKVRGIIRNARQGKLEILPGMNLLESFETRVNQQLRDALNDAGKLALENLAPYNRLKNMVNAGSKGKDTNISQIMACVGQQNVNGERIHFGFSRRSLPHFSKDDYGPESKGFVTSCYVDGLSPTEFYFHAMGGREGLIDTAVKTADTGYIQRRLIKALEDVQVKYDASVRTSKENILQFLYGEDGMNAELIENVNLPLLKMDDARMQKTYCFFEQENDSVQKREKLSQFLESSIVDQLTEDQIEEATEMLNKEFSQLKQDRSNVRLNMLQTTDSQIRMPIDLERLIWNSREKFEIKASTKTDLTPQKVIQRVTEFLDEINVYNLKKRNQSNLFEAADRDATSLIKIYLRSSLSAKKLIQNRDTRLTAESLEWLLGEIKDRYNRSLVHPGEMVGSIAAQSVGEPATQMTLNTFHLAGVGSKNVTLGVPRLKEIINVATTIKTPFLRIYLKEHLGRNQDEVTRFGNEIEYTTLSQIVSNSRIYYDPDPDTTLIKADEDLVELVNRDKMLFSTDKDQEASSPWLIRFEVNSEKMRSRHMSMAMIEKRIRQSLGGDGVNLDIVRHSDTQTLQQMVFRLRISGVEEDDEEESVAMRLREAEQMILNELALKGKKQITKFTCAEQTMESEDQIVEDATGAFKGKQGYFFIDTDGVELKSVMIEEKVDHTIISSNSVREVLTVLGVEAARYSIMKELRKVLARYDIYVNYRHLSTLCDIMTNKGTLTAITRHGINRIDSGVLRKASFEETVEILLEGAVHGELDRLTGVTENIIMGQLAPYGTGCFDLMIDSDFVAQAQFQKVPEKEQISEGVLELNDDGADTPLIDSPIVAPIDGGQTAFGGGQTPYGAFTPASGYDGGQSPMSPTMPYAYNPSGPTLGGRSPTAIGPGQSCYSPNSPAYPKPSYGYQGASPAYQANSPAYQATSPAYAPMSPTRLGGGTPMYSPTPGAPGMYGMSPTRGMFGASSPMYSPTGNLPAYSPTQAYSPNMNPTTPGQPWPKPDSNDKDRTPM